MTDLHQRSTGPSNRPIDAAIAGAGIGIPDEAATPGADASDPPGDEEVARMARRARTRAPENRGMSVELLPPDQLSRELRTGKSADLTRRRWAIGLSFAGSVIGVIVGAYQTGILRRLPDVLPGRIWDAEKVDASDYAYRMLQQPDAPMMVVTYGLTAMALSAGGKDRAEQNPALPLAATAKAAADLALCLGLAVSEWRENRKLCSWCQVATLISAVTLVLSLPESRRALAA